MDDDDDDDDVNESNVDEEDEDDEDDDDDCEDDEDAVGSSNSNVADPQYATLAVAAEVAPLTTRPILNRCLYGLLPNPPTNSSRNHN